MILAPIKIEDPYSSEEEFEFDYDDYDDDFTTEPFQAPMVTGRLVNKYLKSAAQ